MRLKNMEARIFFAQLENRPVEQKNVMREHHDTMSGVFGSKAASYQTYESLCLKAYETSPELEENILENASVSQAVASKWLRVLK